MGGLRILCPERVLEICIRYVSGVLLIKQIQEHFRVFPVSSRDQLLKRFYNGDQKHVRTLNDKLRKLVDRGILEVNREIRPYVYFATPRSVHLRSNHLNHHLAVVDFYLWLTVDEGKEIEVVALEHPLGQKLPRPDMVLRYKGITHYVEIQRSIITDQNMQKRINGYDEACMKGKVMPGELVWIVSPRTYNVQGNYVKIVQTNTIQNKITLS